MENLKKELVRAYEQMKDASRRLSAFPVGPMGLHSDEVKFSSEYRTAKGDFDRAFAMVKQCNAKARRLYPAAWKSGYFRP